MAQEDLRSDPTLSSLMGDVLHGVTALIRKEVDLARSEVDESLARAALGLGLLVGSVVLALAALNVLAASAVAALTLAGLSAGLASLLVGAVLLAAATAALAAGVRRLKASRLAPDRTMDAMRKDAAAFREVLND